MLDDPTSFRVLRVRWARWLQVFETKSPWGSMKRGVFNRGLFPGGLVSFPEGTHSWFPSNPLVKPAGLPVNRRATSPAGAPVHASGPWQAKAPRAAKPAPVAAERD